jgi:peptide methionine sulfoxide reductase MsrA
MFCFQSKAKENVSGCQVQWMFKGGCFWIVTRLFSEKYQLCVETHCHAAIQAFYISRETNYIEVFLSSAKQNISVTVIFYATKRPLETRTLTTVPTRVFIKLRLS